VPAGHDIDAPLVIKRIQDREIALAGHAEDAIDAMSHELRYEELSGIPDIGADVRHGRGPLLRKNGT
jgi:hypothetical protein